MSFYRDPLAGLRSQVATKRGLLAHREAALPSLLRAMLPAELRARLDHLRARALAEEEALEALTQCDAALDEILLLHDEVAHRVPRLRALPDDVPDPRRPSVSPPWLIEERPQLGFRAVFTRRLATIDAHADVVRWDDTTYLSRFRIAGAPLVVASRFESLGGGRPLFHSRIRTSVPDALPALDVRRQGVIADVGRVLGFVRDAEVGDGNFDAAFVVDVVTDATALLPRDARLALLLLVPFGPRLSARNGIAELTWSAVYAGRGEELLPDAAFDAVLGLRAAIERA